MNPPTTARKIAAVAAGIVVMAVAAALVFLLLETAFGAAERTGGKEDKYRTFSSRAGWSFGIALFISAFAGALTCLAIARAKLLKLAVITVLTPLLVVTASLLMDPEGKKPGIQLLPVAACLLCGALLAWYVKGGRSVKD